MLTPEQEKWIAHLSDKDKIKIVPFDQNAEEKFQTVKKKIQDNLGEDILVEHHGATSMGISGQDEIDIYIPVPAKRFNSLLDPLRNIFGEPRSLYPLERARFTTDEGGKHVDVFLVNEEHTGWKNAVKFETYLRTHPEALGSYKKMKEGGNGLTVRNYYRKKLEFINNILAVKGS